MAITLDAWARGKESQSVRWATRFLLDHFLVRTKLARCWSPLSWLGRNAATAYWSWERSFANIMKVIPLSEAKARLSYYSRLCHREPVIVTVKGVPAFQLAPLEEDDDLIDQLLEHNPRFRDYLKACLKTRSLSAAEAMRRLR
jgi:hypothetical protein